MKRVSSTNSSAKGLRVETQLVLPVVYEGLRLDLGYRIDMIVEDEVVLELKAGSPGS